MTDREKLIELRKKYGYGTDDYFANGFLENGVIAPPCKIGDFVRFKGLRNLWKITSMHFYSDGKPQVSVTCEKVTNTMTIESLIEQAEIITKEEAEKLIAERLANI